MDNYSKTLVGQVRNQIVTFANDTTSQLNKQQSSQAAQIVREPSNPVSELPQKQINLQAEEFSLAKLERKMMFLSEPVVQNFIDKNHKSQNSQKSGDGIKALWQVHSKQMTFMYPSQTNQNKATNAAGAFNTNNVLLDSDSFMDNSTSNNLMNDQNNNNDFQYKQQQQHLGETSSLSRGNPRSFNEFKRKINRQFQILQATYDMLRANFKRHENDMDKDQVNLDRLTHSITEIFQDFVLQYNTFVDRETKLNSLHNNAIKKSKELSDRISLELEANSKQRGPLMQTIQQLESELQQKEEMIKKYKSLAENNPDVKDLTATLLKAKLQITDQGNRITDLEHHVSVLSDQNLKQSESLQQSENQNKIYKQQNDALLKDLHQIQTRNNTYVGQLQAKIRDLQQVVEVKEKVIVSIKKSTPQQNNIQFQENDHLDEDYDQHNNQ